MLSNYKEQLLLSHADRERWLRQGLEGRAQEEQGAARHEGDVKGAHNLEALCEECDQRAQHTRRLAPPVRSTAQTILIPYLRFIVNMMYAFQDRDNLYLVMDLLTGGDLRYHICRYRKFSEDQTSNVRA